MSHLRLTQVSEQYSGDSPVAQVCSKSASTWSLESPEHSTRHGQSATAAAVAEEMAGSTEGVTVGVVEVGVPSMGCGLGDVPGLSLGLSGAGADGVLGGGAGDGPGSTGDVSGCDAGDVSDCGGGDVSGC
jgi:hypothetical protein